MNVLLERLKAIHAAHFQHVKPAYLVSGLALLVGAMLLTVFIRVHPAELPAPSPVLLAERAPGVEPLTPDPEPANQSGNITLGATPLPTGNVPSSITVGVQPDPLLADHSQRLDNLETLTAGLKTELAEVEVKLNQCQTTAEDLKKLQAKPPTSALPRTTTQTTRRTRHKVSRHLPRQRRQQAADVQSIPLTKPFVVEAINTWGSTKRIVVKSAYSRHYQHLKVGDPLSKWTIAAVDGQKITLMMQGIRGSISQPNLSSLEALGIHAQSDEERREYAGRLAKMMHEDTERVLAFARVYQEEAGKLNPNSALIDSALLGLGKTPPKMSLHVNDRLLFFTRMNGCPPVTAN